MSAGADSLVLRLFGERWVIDLSGYADPAAHAARLRELWARVISEGEGPIDVVFRPANEGDVIPTALTPRIADRDDGSFPYAFSRAVTQAAIERLAGSALLLHAAGLVSPDGQRGVVLVASSGTGKSTAARRLGQSLGYLSDELMVIDAQERLQGLTKPLSIIVPEFPGGKDESSPDELGLGPTPVEPPQLAALVCLSRAADAGEPRLEPISLHDLIAEVVPQTSSLWRVERPLHRLAEAGLRAGGAYRLRYAEIVDAEPLVEALLSAGTADPVATGDETVEWIGHLPSDADRWAGAAPLTPELEVDDGTVIARAPWTDAIEQDDEISVLAGPGFTRIAGIAATIWLICEVPHTVAELNEELTRAHGPHPEAPTLVRAALSELAGRGLVATRRKSSYST